MRNQTWTCMTAGPYGQAMPRLAVAMSPQRAADVCSPATRRLLADRFDVVWAGEVLDGTALERLVAGSDVVLTSWGPPRLDASLWRDGRGPSVVAHAAG